VSVVHCTSRKLPHSVFESDADARDIDEPTDSSRDRLRDTRLSAQDEHDVEEGVVRRAKDRYGLDGNGLGGDRTEDTDEQRRVIGSEYCERRSLD